MNIRREFVLQVLAKEAPVAELARQYGISRKTEYKWIARFQERGVEGLVDESRRPRTSPLETTSEMAQEIIGLRQSHSRARFTRRTEGTIASRSRTARKPIATQAGS